MCEVVSFPSIERYKLRVNKVEVLIPMAKIKLTMKELSRDRGILGVRKMWV